jgi:anti-sigma regulatory factor (Ser/Thr protein kinase)
VPLNRPALTLGSGPSGVQQARRWVIDTCLDIDRPDLIECAEFGVSELVTNAVLHGAPPITVRVRGTRQHPRVEVTDGSTEPPIMPGSESLGGDDEMLLTFGRGLGIVARCATAWGVEIEEDDKVVWFVPATAPSEDEGIDGVVTEHAEANHRDVQLDAVTHVEVHGVPISQFHAFQVHYRELRREVRLLALAHESDYPLAKTLSDLFGSLDRDLRAGIRAEDIERAQASGQASTDLRVKMPRTTAESIGRFLELLDLADAFCREERLLSLARTPEQRRFQQWFLGEFVRQVRGEAPMAWPDAPEPGRSIVG